MPFYHPMEQELKLMRQIEELKCENANLREYDRYTKEYIDDLKQDVKNLEDELDRSYRENSLMRKLLKEVL